MSLLLNGAKTFTLAGTEMQCLEIYTGEAYTLPITFTDSNGNAANCLAPNAWTLTTSAKYYTVATIDYPSNTPDEIVLGNVTLANQPNANAYTLQAAFINAAAGTAYLYVGSDITGNGNATPTVDLANTSANSTLVIVTLTVTRESTGNASVDNINREPLGFIIRYQ